MQLKNIYSTRRSNSEVYTDLIYEWEDCISEQLEIPIYSMNKVFAKLLDIFDKTLVKIGLSQIYQNLNALINPKDFTLLYHLYPITSFGFKVFSNKIPYLIDFDKNVNVATFTKTYKNCALIFVSSLNAYHLLKQNNCPLNIVHLPLGLANKHELWIGTDSKKYDAIFVRKNKVLGEYAERYAREHPNFNYVKRTWAGNDMYRNNVYISNLEGVLGEFSKRDDYINLLRNTKVAFYATPGCDDPKSKFINHVTPSLFEFIVNGCKIIARYPENSETVDFKLNTISPSYKTYEDFSTTLENQLKAPNNHLKDNELFLEKNFMSDRVLKLKYILENQNKHTI